MRKLATSWNTQEKSQSTESELTKKEKLWSYKERVGGNQAQVGMQSGMDQWRQNQDKHDKKTEMSYYAYYLYWILSKRSM